MELRKVPHYSRSGKLRKVAWLLAFVAMVAVAAGLTIDTRSSVYSNLSNVDGTNWQSEHAIRVAGATQTSAKYRLTHGLSKLPSGSTFKIIWPDGSSEEVSVVSPFSSAGSQPVPGTGKGAFVGGPCDLSPCPDYSRL